MALVGIGWAEVMGEKRTVLVLLVTHLLCRRTLSGWFIKIFQ